MPLTYPPSPSGYPMVAIGFIYPILYAEERGKSELLHCIKMLGLLFGHDQTIGTYMHYTTATYTVSNQQ